MKVLLIDPGKRYLEKDTNVVKPYPHIGLCYLATYLLSRDIETRILDMGAMNLDYNQVIEYFNQYQPELVGITSMTFLMKEVFELCRLIKGINAGITIVLGGAHATSVPELTLEQCKEADLVIRGEGEEVLYEVVKAYRNGKGSVNLREIKGITYRDGERVVSNGAQKLITDLDSLPFPDWSLFDYSKYFKLYSDRFDKEISMYQIAGSRGCPYKCIFCYPLLGHQFRFRSPENVVEEVKWIYERFGAQHIDFTDSTATVDNARFLKFCDLMIMNGLHDKVQWIFETRANLAEAQVMQKAKEAGCDLVYYGLESGDDYILEKMNKQITTSMADQAVKMAKDAGLKVKVSFILGHPYETIESANRTLDFAYNLRSKYGIDMYFNLIDIYPGTQLFDYVDSGIGGTRWLEGKRNNWSTYFRTSPMIEVNDITIEKAMEMYDKFAQMIKSLPSGYSYKLKEEKARKA